MKKIAFLLPVLLAGCSSIGTLTPSAQSTVTNAFNAVCPVLNAISTAKMSAVQAQAYSSALQICANGAPTNLVVAGLDIVAVQSVLAPYLPKVK